MKRCTETDIAIMRCPNYPWKCEMCGAYREPTNADHIRSMTDEEMATDLLPLFEGLCEDGIPSPEYMRFWLKQPYKEDA